MNALDFATKATILVTDDSPDNLSLMRGLLKDDYQVKVANNGETALRIAAANQPPDLILLDIMMPGMDGYEVCKRLKSNPQTRHIPIIFLTAKGSTDDETKGLDLGAADYITKPISPPIVLARIKTHLALKAAADFLRDKNEYLELEVGKRTCQVEEIKGLMIQSERMAAVGLLAAGVAHEINNPAGYVYSNLGTLQAYIQRLLRLLEAHEQITAGLPEEFRQITGELERVRQQVLPAQLIADLPQLIAESLEGVEAIIRIVGDLKDFSHVDAKEGWQQADLNKLLGTTLNVVKNELKYKAEVRKEFGVLPAVTCLPFQLNQVFMNLLVNAGQSIQDHGVITVRTGTSGDQAWVEIGDTGGGIPETSLQRIFEPFFTTKPVGKGTGLGLSISYGIVKRHHGRIDVVSELGRGSTFKVWLPIHQTLPLETVKFPDP